MSGGADNRSRERRLMRLRTRIASIEPEDNDMIQVVAILKGLLDIIGDEDGAPYSRSAAEHAKPRAFHD